MTQNISDTDCRCNEAIEAFKKLIPGRTDSAVENEIYLISKNDPVEYWIQISRFPKWKALVNITLHIISIRPSLFTYI